MKLRSKLFSSLFSLLFLSLAVVTLLNRQNIYDWYVLQGYQPSPIITKLASDSGMTDYARRLFYVNKPELLGSETFNQKCTDYEETIVLGCYDGLGIYIFDVTDPRLEGIEQVTAAHEMLHVGYERLSSSERARVDTLLENQYSKVKDERILKNIESYRKKDESVIANEMHSIFGTEINNLDPELETYYRKYFSDRNKVVSLSASYESVFTEIKNKVDEMDVKLVDLKTQIDALEGELRNEADRLTNWSNELNRLKSSNQISEYNSQVNSYNSAVYAYRDKLNREKELIEQYNALVNERNELALQQNSLYKSIDSSSKEL